MFNLYILYAACKYFQNVRRGTCRLHMYELDFMLGGGIAAYVAARRDGRQATDHRSRQRFHV